MKYAVEASHTVKITRKPVSNAALMVVGGRIIDRSYPRHESDLSRPVSEREEYCLGLTPPTVELS